MHIKVRRATTDFLYITAAALLYSIGLHCFTAPNDIAPGGVTGIATIISSFSGINVGLLYGLVNLPLLIIGFIYLGKTAMVKTVVAVAVITFTTDVLLVNVPEYTGDRLLAAIFGGALFGAALGLIYLREGTSGGTDIVNKLINKRYPQYSLGMVTLATDFVIVVGAMLFYGSIESGLYAIISIVVASKVLDVILYGSTEARMLLIFSEKQEQITQRLLSGCNRGVTILRGYGAYTKRDKDVICCAVRKSEYAGVRRAVTEEDANAFVIITSVSEVFGEGFSDR